QVLRYYINRGKDLKDVEENIKKLENEIGYYNDIEGIMAMEGNIREYYYRSFDTILGKAAFTFEKRTRRPPRNYLNTLIGFGNSLLYTIVLSETYQTHLDPCIGFLHATNFKNFTVNFEVSEIFKLMTGDRVIVTVVGRNMLTDDDFEKGMD